MAILEVHELVKHYRRGTQMVRALNGVTFHVDQGSFLVIMGRSGSGKSTLLHLIGCLDRPTSGSIHLCGRVLDQVPEQELPAIRRAAVGFVFQRFHLLPTLSALENVMLPLKYARVSSEEAQSRACALLEAVEMKHRLAHRPVELSGGEQQRVAIARALANRPTVVLADEPTGELDSETASTTIQLMKQLNETLGQTFLVVTHDDLLARQAHRVIRLRDGRIEEDRPTSGSL